MAAEILRSRRDLGENLDENLGENLGENLDEFLAAEILRSRQDLVENLDEILRSRRDLGEKNFAGDMAQIIRSVSRSLSWNNFR